MKSLKEIRNEYSLSQGALAKLLAVTKSQLNMAERGERDLPATALLLFSNLLIKSKSAANNAGFTSTGDSLGPNEEKVLKAMSRRVGECEWSANRLQVKLELMEASFLRQQVLLNIIEESIREITGISGKTLFSIEMEIQRDELLKKMTRCNLARRIVIEKKIRLLKAEAMISQEILLRNKKQE